MHDQTEQVGPECGSDLIVRAAAQEDALNELEICASQAIVLFVLFDGERFESLDGEHVVHRGGAIDVVDTAAVVVVVVQVVDVAVADDVAGGDVAVDQVVSGSTTARGSGRRQDGLWLGSSIDGLPVVRSCG